MAETTLQDVGLGTIEERMPGPGQADYANYWLEMQDAYYPQLLEGRPDKDLRSKIRHADMVVSRVREGLLVDGDVTKVDGYLPDFSGNTRPTYVSTIRMWSDALGNFNPLRQAHSDLEAAASLAMQESATGPGTPARPLSIEETLERFPVTTMKSSAGLILAAQLLQRAEIVKPAYETGHLSTAMGMYQQALESLKPGNEHFINANLMLDDITYDESDQLARAALAAGEFAAADEHMAAIYGLMGMAALRVTELAELAAQNPRRVDLKGRVFEAVLPLIVRDAIVGELENDVVSFDGGHFSIRQAFGNEEKSQVTNRGLKPAFDTVVSRVYDDGLVATPVQLKYGVGGMKDARPTKGWSPTEKVSADPKYLPGIMVLRVANVSLAQLRQVGKEMAGKYEARSYGDDCGSLPQTTTLQEQVLQELQAA